MDVTRKTRPGADLWTQASDIRRQARHVLDGHSGRSSHRMTLILALILTLTVAIALYAATAGISVAGFLLFGEIAWVEAVSNVLLIALLLGLVLPLLTSVLRLACLMSAPDGETVDGLPVEPPYATLSELFYPFTSLRAYGRTMAVGMEGLAWVVLTVGIPILGFRLASLSLSTLQEQSSALYVLVMIAVTFICLGWSFGALLLSGRRAGFGYWVFVHDRLPLGDVNRYFGGFRRPLLPVLCLRLSLAGWIALSVVGIFVPFLLHTAPYALCCSTVYSRSLQRF